MRSVLSQPSRVGPVLTAAELSTDLVRATYRWVERAYPEEGRGFLFEREGQLELVPTENRATLLHQLDPENYPRDGRTYFEPDMKPWLRACREGAEPRLIFHSHPDTEAYFSETDRASALIEDDSSQGVLERNPGIVHLVVSVLDGRAKYAKLFRFETPEASFVEIGHFNNEGQLKTAQQSVL